MENIKDQMYNLCVKYVGKKYRIMSYLKKTKLFMKLYNFVWRERSVSYGEDNLDKTFYVIRRESQIEGICSMFNSVIGHLAYADSQGYIPVVDMQNYYNILWQPFSRRKKENAWEYYFEQPAGYSLADIKKSKNVILSDAGDAHKVPNLQGMINDLEVKNWNRIYHKYIKLNTKIEKKINTDEIRLKQENIMGVCQRVAIISQKIVGDILFEGYAKTYTVTQMIQEVEKRMKLNNCDKIFLVIDDEEAAEKFKKHFRDRLLLFKRKRIKYFTNDEPTKKGGRGTEKEIISRNISYIKEIFLLARCNFLLCDQSTGAMTAIIINGNQYEKRMVLRS